MARGPRTTAPTPQRNNGPVSPAPAIAQAAAAAIPYVQTAVVAGIAVAGAFALRDVSNLYNARTNMASQFQQDVTFPSDLIQSNRDFYVSFKFQKYEKRSIQNSPFLRSEGGVRLPLPGSLKDNMSVNYENASLGAGVGAALEGALGTGQIVGSDIGSTISNFSSAATNAAYGAAQGTAAERLANATGAAGQAASAYFGAALNPYQTVLFKNPDFKSHTFSWKLMPRDAQETAAAREIIRTFQYHMSPGVSETNGLFFSYPSMVIVSLFPSSDFLYRFKPCVVKNVSVDYASGSSPSFFKGTKAPTSITLSIQLQEIEYWTNNDFTANAFSDVNAIQAAFRVGNNPGAVVAPTTRAQAPTEP